MNALIDVDEDDIDGRKVFVKDMLFATLETSLRKSRFNNGGEFLLIDTVGFVSDLPTHLVEAFKSTLEEIRYADVIVQVVDVLNEKIDLQIETTNMILKDLGIDDRCIIYAFNKVDGLEEDISLNRFSSYSPNVFISAKYEKNLDELLDLIYENLPFRTYDVELFFDYSMQGDLNYFMDKYKFTNVEYSDKGTRIKVTIDEFDYNKYKENVVG